MTALMVQGCTSWAGKSLLTTVLCRWLSDLGVDVAPFKGQNMANNARVTSEGEVGVAQWLQAHAARVEPSVLHNPVLLKPEAETRSQVIVDGQVRDDLTAMPWRDRSPHLWSPIRSALHSLLGRHEVVVIEGAGSPAEINLPDVVNRRVATEADAAVLLVADVDRGGAFAHLYGTWALLEPADRDRYAGFVLNRFRGDATLLAPAPEVLEERTGVPTVGVVPMLRHGLPDEDGARSWPAPSADGPLPRVAVLRGPAASNLDELAGVAAVAELRWASRPGDLVGADLVLLPGSKHVVADRAWLADTGLDRAVVEATRAGTRVLGVCGGAMLLGRAIEDPTGIEGGRPGRVEGLGLLEVHTRLERDKHLAVAPARFAASLPHAWHALSGTEVATTYEIRHGRVTGERATSALDQGRGWVADNVLGVTAHGLLEDPEVVARLLGVAPPPSLDAVLDELTAAVVPHLDTDLLLRLVSPDRRRSP